MGTKEPRWKVPSLFWLPIVVCLALLFAVDVFQSPYTMIQTRLHAEEPVMDQRSLKGFVIKTPGCRIPDMNPMDDSIKKFIYKVKKPVCNKGIPALVDSNHTSIFRVEAALSSYTNHTMEEVMCCYQPFHREEPGPNEQDTKVKFNSTCTPFGDDADIRDEFIRVTCTVTNHTIYTDFFSFVPVKVQERRRFARKPLSVLVLGLDAVSRLNLYRQMPTTVEYLKNISAVEMLGYNKVADNTHPNLIPVLTGHTPEELDLTCMNRSKHFDNCSYMWDLYKKEGFTTSFAEDATWMGMFNFYRKGFQKQPTDYMWTTFDRIAEKQIGNRHEINVDQCIGARMVYKVFLDYVGRFVTKMHLEDLPFFAFFWEVSLSHDVLNKPSLGDLDYYHFFKGLKESNYLNDTVLVFMSDHGIRWGDIRQTYQGRMEERLPFLFFVLPDWYKAEVKEAYSNLVKNSRRLTTPFDLHETLKDLVHPFTPSYHYQNASRGYSLFSPVSASRTCEDAAISSHWCTCQQSKEIPKNDTVVAEAASFAVEHMNRELEGYAECANLTLYNISNARMMSHGDHILNGNDVRDYTIVLQTTPGDGVFEVTLRYGKNNTFEVMGTISRLNLYGKQSACITDFHLKLYCYCKYLLA